MTNTDVSDFAEAHPKDGEKFATFFSRARPEWEYDVFSVKDGVFPESIEAYDAAAITGSPASVHDGETWIAQLEGLIREMHVAQMPMFGACFGHQVIATALGGAVGPNPKGWVFGAVTTKFLPEDRDVNLFAAHKEQVVGLPEGARVVARTQDCPIAGYRIAEHILTTQYHPEMTPAFFAALVEELRGELGDAICDKAESTLGLNVDMESLARWAAAFFEDRLKARAADCRETRV